MAVSKGCEILMNNIVTVREKCQWADALALLFTDPWGHAHTFCPPGNVLIDGRLDSLAVNYIDYLWMSGANKDWSSLHFFGPCLIMRELHSHDFLINPVSAGLRTYTKGQMGERGGGSLVSLYMACCRLQWFDKIKLFWWLTTIFTFLLCFGFCLFLLFWFALLCFCFYFVLCFCFLFSDFCFTFLSFAVWLFSFCFVLCFFV